MKDKIFEEALEWYNKRSSETEVDLKEFVDLVINKTAKSIIDQVKNEFSEEFKNGNLKHNLFISSDYFLNLKLKDIKNQCTQNYDFDEEFVENDEKKEEKE
jgi:hypothetical protein